jgi:hypothetical protein
MNILINQLVQSLLQKDTLEQCSVEELQQIAGGYPYFSTAHLLLIKKLQMENAGQYNEQLQKASLHFQNPLWLEQLLNNTGDATVIAAESSDTAIDKSEEKIEARIIDEIKTEPAEVLENKEPDPVVQLPEYESGLVEKSFVQKAEEPLLEIPSMKIESPDNYRDDPANAELSFEPYHMVDYFASQGIKFKEEDKPKDKFGQQLKSFTDWLKTMKRLPVTEITKATEINAEQKVDQLAEHSIQDREVVTEAMAEVWEKQGNIVKASEIYSKLSLLDPLKRPYFAAKIEALKKIN